MFFLIFLLLYYFLKDPRVYNISDFQNILCSQLLWFFVALLSLYKLVKYFTVVDILLISGKWEGMGGMLAGNTVNVILVVNAILLIKILIYFKIISLFTWQGME